MGKKVVRKRRMSKKAKKAENFKIACWIGFVALLLLCYLNLGLLFTIFTGIGIGIIVYVSYLLKKYSNDKKKKKKLNIFLIAVLSLGIIALVLLAIFLIFVTISAPKFDTAKLNTSEVTIIYDKNKKQIAKLGSEMREKVTYDELPQVLVDAIVATEDSRFFQHNGFDAARFAKASAGQLGGNSDAGGASTLSMQVIKNSFTSTESTGVKGVVRKFTDIYLAVFKLEKRYSKEEIIEFYVNNHFLGGNIYGVQEASKHYFGKNVSELNLSEAAVLAGMFKSPNYYRPTANPKNATARRKTVLYLMRKHGYITKEEEKAANAVPIETITSEAKEEKENEYQGYIDTVVEEVKEKYNVNAYTAPLLIYTNMDPKKQDAVNSVLKGETYDWVDNKVQTGVSVLDSKTGKILAIGSGRNRQGLNSYNYATQIKRQPGSSAKPLFDYGPGIEYNYWSTAQVFDDSPYHYSNGKPIRNWDRGYFGRISLRRALSASRNVPALKAFQQVDNKKILNFVTTLGIKPEVCSNGYEYDYDRKRCVSLTNSHSTKEPTSLHEAHAIGAFTGVSPLEMSAAYAAFSNGGYYNEPYSVKKITFRDNGVTKTHKTKRRKAMSDATAFMISSVLQDVKLTGGTPNNVACKTGTTNYDSYTMDKNNLPGDAIRDSWVIGYSTKTVIGMWYGYDFIDSQYCLRNLPATMQKDRLFNALVSSGAMEKRRNSFKQPSSVVKLGVVAGTDPPKIASGGGNVIYEYFRKGHEPTGKAEAEKNLSAPGGLNATFDSNTNKVTLTWGAVSPLKDSDESYGQFGYNVYFGSTLLTFTNKTSYVYVLNSGASPYGVYKVIATYKSYSGVQSPAATFVLKEPAKPTPEPTTCPSDAKLENNKCVCNDPTKTYDESTKTCK